MQKIQCIVLGDASVGKTTFLQHATRGALPMGVKGTIGVDNILYRSDTHTLQCWDTSGSERFIRVIPLFARKCQVVIYMFDVSKPETLDKIEFWRSLIPETPPLSFIIPYRLDLPSRCGEFHEIKKKYPDCILMNGNMEPKYILEEIIALFRTTVHTTKSLSVESEHNVQTCCFGIC